MNARRIFEWGGLAAGIVLIAFGIGAIAMGVDGRSTVRDSLKQEQVFFGEATDPAVAEHASKWAGEQVTTGDQARAFALVMREHGGEIDVRQEIAVVDEDRTRAAEPGASSPERTRGPEDFGLVGEVHRRQSLGRPRREEPAQRIRKMMQIDDRVREPVAGEAIEHLHDHRAPEHRDRGLRDAQRERQHALAEPGR